MSISVLVPLKLDVFILNEACCNSEKYKIAPITQPKYVLWAWFARLGRLV